MSSSLIAGLGNPGIKYAKTRHNIGFEVVRQFAKNRGIEFKLSKRFIGYVAEVGEDKCFLLLPLTFMNNSGQAVKLFFDFFKIELEKFLVVADDADLPFGKLRFKPPGSGSGGHKGIDSISENLQTASYARLRVGIGRGREEDLADYVLGKFSKEEKEVFPQIMSRASQAIELWLTNGLEYAMNNVNKN